MTEITIDVDDETAGWLAERYSSRKRDRWFTVSSRLLDRISAALEEQRPIQVGDTVHEAYTRWPNTADGVVKAIENGIAWVWWHEGSKGSLFVDHLARGVRP